MKMSPALKQMPRKKFLIAAAAVLAACALLPGRLSASLPADVEMKDMTWIEVRSAIDAGYTTVIVPTGGIEQNGPHMILGKHDYIVAEAARRIAKDVGHTLVAPVVSYVPEGGYNPPTGHMRFPGTMGVPEPVFAGVLEGIARSLKAGGFKLICFIGDHGQSQPAQTEVARRLSAEWAKDGVRVVEVGAYYADKAQVDRLIAQGRSRAEVGQHASVIDTSELMSVDPKGVDLSRYRAALENTGVSGDPTTASPELGSSLLAMRIAAAANEIRSLLAMH
jgi:creatinine amidohydrolase